MLGKREEHPFAVDINLQKPHYQTQQPLCRLQSGTGWNVPDDLLFGVTAALLSPGNHILLQSRSAVDVHELLKSVWPCAGNSVIPQRIG